jgi:hypothetical protein
MPFFNYFYQINSTKEQIFTTSKKTKSQGFALLLFNFTKFQLSNFTDFSSAP